MGCRKFHHRDLMEISNTVGSPAIAIPHVATPHLGKSSRCVSIYSLFSMTRRHANGSFSGPRERPAQSKNGKKGSAYIRSSPGRRIRFGIDRHNFATGFLRIWVAYRTE
jgi:hypothetical protein